MQQYYAQGKVIRSTDLAGRVTTTGYDPSSSYLYNTHFKTKEEAIKAIEEAIRIYNTRRLHEKCGFKQNVN